MIGNIREVVYLCVLSFGLLFSGCSSKSYIFGEEEGFCQDCGYQFKGVCANPMDIYYNSDAIVNKRAKCDKKESNRAGVRN